MHLLLLPRQPAPEPRTAVHHRRDGMLEERLLRYEVFPPTWPTGVSRGIP
jgi:hypothetical protein